MGRRIFNRMVIEISLAVGHCVSRHALWMLMHERRVDPEQMSAEEVAEFRARALALAQARQTELDLPAEFIADAAAHYAASKQSRSFGSVEALRAVFEDHGFALDTFDSGGEAERRRDRPSGPTLGWQSERFRIVAVRR